MKYQISITRETADELKEMMDKSVRINYEGVGEVKILAEAHTVDGEIVYLALLEGNTIAYLWTKLISFIDRIDCVRRGWPELEESK